MTEELMPHTIILSNYWVVAICLTKDIAESIAEARGYEDYRIEVTTKRDIACLLDGHAAA